MTDKEATYTGKEMPYMTDKEASYTGNGDALYDRGSHLHWEDLIWQRTRKPLTLGRRCRIWQQTRKPLTLGRICLIW